MTGDTLRAMSREAVLALDDKPTSPAEIDVHRQRPTRWRARHMCTSRLDVCNPLHSSITRDSPPAPASRSLPELLHRLLDRTLHPRPLSFSPAPSGTHLITTSLRVPPRYLTRHLIPFHPDLSSPLVSSISQPNDLGATEPFSDT